MRQSIRTFRKFPAKISNKWKEKSASRRKYPGMAFSAGSLSIILGCITVLLLPTSLSASQLTNIVQFRDEIRVKVLCKWGFKFFELAFNSHKNYGMSFNLEKILSNDNFDLIHDVMTGAKRDLEQEELVDLLLAADGFLATGRAIEALTNLLVESIYKHRMRIPLELKNLAMFQEIKKCITENNRWPINFTGEAIELEGLGMTVETKDQFLFTFLVFARSYNSVVFKNLPLKSCDALLIKKMLPATIHSISLENCPFVNSLDKNFPYYAFKFNNLTHFKCTNSFGEVLKILELLNAGKLVHLDISGCKLDVKYQKRFTNCLKRFQNLQVFDFSASKEMLHSCNYNFGNDFVKIKGSILKLSALKSLYVSNNLDFVSFVQVLNKFEGKLKLEQLDLSNNRILPTKRGRGNPERKYFELLCNNFVKLANLKYLNLNNSKIYNYYNLLVANLEHLVALEEFVLINHFCSVDIKLLESVLTERERPSHIENQSFRSQNCFDKMRMLKRIFLYSPKITEILFEGEFNCTEELRLNLDQFTGEEANSAVVFFDKFKKLKLLTVVIKMNVNLTFLAQLLRNNSIEELSLEFCNTFDQFEELGNILKKYRFSSLHFIYRNESGLDASVLFNELKDAKFWSSLKTLELLKMSCEQTVALLTSINLPVLHEITFFINDKFKQTLDHIPPLTSVRVVTIWIEKSAEINRNLNLFLKLFPQLTNLTIMGQNSYIRAFNPVPILPNLRTLSFEYKYLYEDDEFIKQLCKLPLLTSVSLNSCSTYRTGGKYESLRNENFINIKNNLNNYINWSVDEASPEYSSRESLSDSSNQNYYYFREDLLDFE